MSLSANIKRLRLENNMTQEQLAASLGVTAQAVSKWEICETYPDGPLLVPLAKALGTSLDELFNNDEVSMEDISKRIMRIIKKTDKDSRFELIRDVCWQIERGLFNCYMPINEKYDQHDIISRRLSSHILSDHGFTMISNGKEPFFSAFFEPREGFGYFLDSMDSLQDIFKSLSSPNTLRAIVHLHKHDESYVFEASVLAKECNIDPDSVGKVINDLEALRLIREKTVLINGKERTLYYSTPSHNMIALFLVAKELAYCGGHCLSASKRQKPYIK